MQTQRSERRDYVAPKLVVYGSVAGMTGEDVKLQGSGDAYPSVELLLTPWQSR
jgi:hypothetical protein